MDQEEKNVLSTLKMLHCVIDELHFERKGFQPPEGPKENKARFTRNISKDSDGHYRVGLAADIDRENEFEMRLVITGYFQLDESDPNKQMLLEKNAVAILFPFLRSEITLLTTQPEMMPIVLPVVNIAAMFDEAAQDKSEE